MVWDCKQHLFSFGDSSVQSAQFCELSTECITMNRHQKPELWTGIWGDGKLGYNDRSNLWDLAILQMSEGTQGARMPTLHPPLPGNFSRHLTCQGQVCDLIPPVHVWFRCPLTVAPFHPKPLLPATAVHILDRGVVGSGL